MRYYATNRTEYDQSLAEIYVADDSDALEADNFTKALDDTGVIELVGIFKECVWVSSDTLPYQSAVKSYAAKSDKALAVIGEEMARRVIGDRPDRVVKERFKRAFNKPWDDSAEEAERVAHEFKRAVDAMDPKARDVLRGMLGPLLEDKS